MAGTPEDPLKGEMSLTAELSDTELVKCGFRTRSACFALFKTEKGMKCLGVLAELYAQQGDESWRDMLDIIGGGVAWRQNIDETDKWAWCPKRFLNHSKP